VAAIVQHTIGSNHTRAADWGLPRLGLEPELCEVVSIAESKEKDDLGVNRMVA